MRFSTRSLMLCALFAALMGVCSQLSIPLPMVPINLALFAALLANTPLPLTLVRPLACAAASAGAALSGFLLARKLKKQMLLCGLGSGAFWAACQSVAAIAMSGQDLLQGGNLMLPIALLLGGILGGALAAVWAVR